MEKSIHTIKIEAACEINEETAIGIAYESNGLFKLNTNTGKIKYISMIPNEKVSVGRLYTVAFCYKNKVFFVPMAAMQIAVYDVEKEIISKIDIKNMSGYSKNMKFSGCVPHGKYLFLIPCTYPAVIRLDMETGKTDYYDDWINGEEFIFRKAPEIIKNKFYIPSVLNDFVLEFDMEKCIGVVHHLGTGSGYWCACAENNTLWFTPIKQDPVIRWNPELKEIVKINEYPSGFKGRGFAFTKAYIQEKKLFLIPAKGNMGVTIDMDSMKMFKTDIQELLENDVTTFMIDMGDYLYLNTLKEGKERGIRIRKSDNSVSQFTFFLDEREWSAFWSDYIKGMIEEKEVLRESNMIGIDNFLQVVVGTL